MSKHKKKVPVDFLPVNDPRERTKFLRQGAKSFASTTVWTKNQQHLLRSHISAYIEGGKHAGVYCWVPKEFDTDTFEQDMHRMEKPLCYFSVGLPTAHVFFFSLFRGIDNAEGLAFDIPEDIFKVQRRKDQRLPIPDGYLIKVDFQDPFIPENRISKRILDVSAGGLSFIVDHDEEAMYREGQVLALMTFRIRGHLVNTEAEIRYLKPLLFDQRHKGVKVGVQFLTLQRKDFDYIKDYVMEESRKYFSQLY